MANNGIEFFLKVRDGFSNPLGTFANKLKGVQNPLGSLKRGISNFNPHFSSGNLGNFRSQLQDTGSMLKSMTGANLISSGITNSLAGIKSGVGSLYGELNESTEAWGTFNNNMQMMGQGQSQIDKTRQDLQNYAQATIYSSSDMASSYSQLAASGVKNADSLVKGFGGLASTAGNSKQAMKSLSEQSIQAAAQPQIKWEDFRIMMQQAPAGMTQVAKTMGMSMQDLIQQVHSGKVQTQDFFNAVSKTGNSKQMTHMAAQYKTLGQAVDGLREETANKLQPVFQKVSGVGIRAISNLIDSFSDLNIDKYAKPMENGLQGIINATVSGFNTAKKVVSDFMSGLNQTNVLTNVQWSFSVIKNSFSDMQNSGKGNGITNFIKTIGSISGNAINGIANVLASFSTTLSKMKPATIKSLAAAFILLKASTKGIVVTGIVLLFNVLNKASPNQLNMLAHALTGVAIALAAFKAFKGAKSIFDMFKSTPKTPKAPTTPKTPPATNVGSWIKFGTSMLMVGGALILAGTGMLIMAHAATTLASGGGTAIGVMVGIVAAIGILVAVVAHLGPSLISGSIGFGIFGVALLIVAASVWVAAEGIKVLSAQLPTIAQYGIRAGLGLMVVGAGMAVAGAAALIAAVGAVAFGAACFVLGAGLLLVGVGLITVGAGLTLVGHGVSALAVGFRNMINVVVSIFHRMAAAASDAMSSLKTHVSNGIHGAVNTVRNFFGSFKSAGSFLMSGLVHGISAGINKVKEVAGNVGRGLVDKVHKIWNLGSPSKLFNQYGRFLDQGLVLGINHDAGKTTNAAGNMAQNVANNAAPSNQNIPSSNPFSSGKPSYSTDNSDNSRNNTNRSNDNSITIQNVNVTGGSNPQQTAKELVAKLENYLQNAQEGRLS